MSYEPLRCYQRIFFITNGFNFQRETFQFRFCFIKYFFLIQFKTKRSKRALIEFFESIFCSFGKHRCLLPALPTVRHISSEYVRKYLNFPLKIVKTFSYRICWKTSIHFAVTEINPHYRKTLPSTSTLSINWTYLRKY